MSINVTVSGNPVRINRGKMVTSYDPAKSEFEKRRLIRLGQVRQQSKDIAENIRNKSKKEKEKCLSEVEKDGEIKLKNWQARKLLELQNQYQEALDEIGLGQKNAAVIEDEEDMYFEEQEGYKKLSKERGRQAAELMQIERNEENLKKAVPKQRKILTNDVENSRSDKIVNTLRTKRGKSAKKAKKDFDSDSENRVPQLTLDESDEKSDSSLNQEITRKRSGAQKTKEQQTTTRICREQQTSAINFQVPTSDKAAQTVLHEEHLLPTTLPTSNKFPIDTRISERIKRRTRLEPATDYCDFAESRSTKTCCNCCCSRGKHLHENVPEVRDREQRNKLDIIQTFPAPTDRVPRNDSENITRKSSDQQVKSTEVPTRPFDKSAQIPQRFADPKSALFRHQSDDRTTIPQFEDETADYTLDERKTAPKTAPFRHRSDDTIPQRFDEEPPAQHLDEHKTAPFRQPFEEEPSHLDDRKTAPFRQRFEEEPSHLDDRKTAPFRQRSDPRTDEDTNLDDRRTAPPSRKPSTRRNIIPGKSDDRQLKTYKSTIPAKPRVTLKSSRDRPVYIETENPQPVQYYDHPNRFGKTYLPKSSHVEKIDDDEIVISPNILSEDEMREKMRQRDIEAHKRGQLALEKEKVQREYRDLMKKLPVLQKQERIFEIGANKQKYHMAKNRLEEFEKKRQNRLDNAYEELFVRKQPALVTIPRKTDAKEENHLNLADWDVDFDRTNTLNGLLSNLKSQKELLLKEIESTFSKDTLTQLTKTSSDDIKSKSTDYSRVKRKRSRDDRPTSPTSSDTKLEESSETTKSKKSTSPSPRKKAKVKSSRKLLVLQNTSTQTTPKTEYQSAATSPIATIETCTKHSPEDVCEIVIKIKEDEKPKIEVNPSSGKAIKVSEVEPALEASKKSTSWRDQLSYSTQSTTSTSYLDPPGKKKVAKTVKTPETEDTSRSVNSTSSSAKEKKVGKKSVKTPETEDTSRSTTSSSAKELDPRLLTYIKKLLNMSRTSIDQLTVSTASEVSTPTHSVIEAPSNNPLQHLMNVMKYFNINMADLEKQLSYTSDESSKHYNTKESLTLTSQSEGENSHVQSYSSVSSKKVKESKELLKFADIAASYTKKINDLTAKIEQVRAEKKKILESSSSGSDKDLTTTSYRDLPGKKEGDSMDELLKIDYDYAEKLKQLSNQEIESEKKRTDKDTDDELLSRLKRLLESNPSKGGTVVEMTEKKLVQDSGGDPVGLVSQKKQISTQRDGKNVGVLTEHTSVTLKPTDQSDKPLFLDIPKLPKLESSVDKKNKRPPPSKGLRAIAAVPHELSTIVEADSQLSTKADSPTKPQDMPDILAEVKSSSDDVSEMDTMETMLISIGMEWAIPTLKKTREALAMSSSSSNSKESGEVSLKEFLSKISASTSKSGEASSSASETQGMSLIQIDQRRTSTPNVEHADKREGPIFLTDSDVSSVRELSEANKDSEQFFDLNEGSVSKSR